MCWIILARKSSVTDTVEPKTTSVHLNTSFEYHKIISSFVTNSERTQIWQSRTIIERLTLNNNNRNNKNNTEMAYKSLLWPRQMEKKKKRKRKKRTYLQNCLYTDVIWIMLYWLTQSEALHGVLVQQFADWQLTKQWHNLYILQTDNRESKVA